MFRRHCIRLTQKYARPSPGRIKTATSAISKGPWDVIIVGGGHNGLVAAGYLAKKLKVLVLERRHIVGGAAVTEEIVPNFKFSRASYLAGLLRPQIIEDLKLTDFGFEYLPRSPASFTPTIPGPTWKHGQYLLLGTENDAAEIARFSEKDAAAFVEYEKFLTACRELITPFFDAPLPNLVASRRHERIQALKTIAVLAKRCWIHQKYLVDFYELYTAPIVQVLNRWFESEILKTTLATDAVIGSQISTKQIGSAYILLHHVMGETLGRQGVWAYVRGGMGGITTALRRSAEHHGCEVHTNVPVERILPKGPSGAGVRLADGTELRANVVVSNCNPYHTFVELLDQTEEVRRISHRVKHNDWSCGSFKINCAVNKLPRFRCVENILPHPGPQHRGTVHFEQKLEELENAFRDASMGIPAAKPVVEMTIPSVIDETLAPEGQHVVQLFVQYAPYEVDPAVGSWDDPVFKEAFVHRVFAIVDQYLVESFTKSVIGYDALSPLDLEHIFGLERGNIFHGALSLNQIGYTRPTPSTANHRTPIAGLYLCGAGSHPGGGVTGAPGRNCALTVLSDLGFKM